MANVLNVQPIPKRGNVKFVVPYDEGVFYGQQRANVRISESVVSDVNVVSNVQLFVDLFNYPARGMEAAEHLFKLIVERWGKAVYGDVHV